jgi:ABC-2 type transport system permease protein
MERKKRTARELFGQTFRRGSYSAAISLLVLVVVIVLNLVVSSIPATYTKFDTTTSSLFTLSEQTEQVLAGLDTDVTIYIIAENGSEDSYVTSLLEQYTARTSHLKVVTKDPVLYPNFASQYTDESLATGSLIVESSQRSKVVPYSDLYEYTINYYTYSYTASEFDGENEITSAIDYVVSDTLPTAYYLTGHGETELSTTLLTYVEDDNITLESLSLVSQDAVPDDAQCVLIVAPTTDLSADEAAALKAYLEDGGNLFLLTNCAYTDLPNLMEVMAYYGVAPEEGIVMEGSASNRLRNYPHYLLPNIESHTITSALTEGNYYVLAPVAHAITTLSDVRSSLSITDLLTTSDSAYLKSIDTTTTEKEDGDPSGPFSIGVAITEDHDDVETQLVWLACDNILNSQMDSMVSGANTDLFLACLGWMCGSENAISIHSKSLSVSYLTVPDAAANGWSVLYIFIIPVVLLICGAVVMVRRRKR